MVRLNGVKTFIAGAIELGYLHYSPTFNEIEDYIVSYSGRVGQLTAFFKQYTHGRKDLTDKIESIKLPVKIFWGDEDGFLKVWVNDKLVLEALNIKNITPYTKRGVGLDFGIYQTFVSGWKREHGDKDYPNMVVYFDEVNLGTSKEKVIKNLGN